MLVSTCCLREPATAGPRFDEFVLAMAEVWVGAERYIETTTTTSHRIRECLEGAETTTTSR